MEEKNCCKLKSTPRDPKNIKDITQRLNRVAGQINGVKKMIEEGRYCIDIMVQISACEKALVAVGDILLKEHLETCVVEEIKQDNLAIVAETMDIIKTMR